MDKNSGESFCKLCSMTLYNADELSKFYEDIDQAVRGVRYNRPESSNFLSPTKFFAEQYSGRIRCFERLIVLIVHLNIYGEFNLE